MLSRREWLVRALSGAAASAAVGALLPERLLALTDADALATAPDEVVLYKSPTCGCCHMWQQRMEAAGFAFVVHDVADVTPMKQTLGVPERLQSCHTAIVGKYVFEGHVPPDLVTKVLREKPALIGLAVPGMPNGAPGMEMPGKKDRYDVVAFARGGKTWVYASR